MEFQEVMRQWVRARKVTASNLDENVLSGYPLEMYTDDHIANLEKEVMAWAAEHPEPVYPTWMDYLLMQEGCKEAYSGGNDTLWKWMWTEHIPADIAEKLGLQPKEDV